MGAIDPSNYTEEVIEYVYLPWNIEVKQYLDGGYFAKVVELPGCMTEADSAAEALEALEEARAEWLTAALEMGQKIPVPLALQDYSGKIFVRTSPDLHRKVAEAAARQGVSMSQWVGEVLASRVETEDLDEVLGRVRRSIDFIMRNADAIAEDIGQREPIEDIFSIRRERQEA